MDLSARPVLIGLGFIIAVCGAVVLWVERNSAAPMDFIERHLGFSPDNGDGSMEVVLAAALVLVITYAQGRGTCPLADITSRSELQKNHSGRVVVMG